MIQEVESIKTSQLRRELVVECLYNINEERKG